ncbi:PEP-CTERM sorting domain-containing protein [Verrucomicrobiaceae bacterium N1E253]|uniref:PEP-CTERM sorting domain-containing protein n=1 Tax=Oceaniferula marina TaxID=2748318 RepID=A0A851GH39_9BACT|nr:PEP-CTERM sorting domain-containing protein [Oceaniferula marina]NWK56676.1 PEP-CTERM sorting domain-containing protein [Oceaniferula marina]
MKNITTSLVALAATTAMSQAAIVAFSAEDGLLGSNWITGVSDAGELNPGAIGGAYVTSSNATGDSPTSANQVATYTVALDAATTYDLYVRIRVDENGGNSAGVDSIFIGEGFGIKVLGDNAQWTRVNGLNENSNSYVNPESVEITNDTWNWVKFSGQVTQDEPVGTFTTATGVETFQVGHREELWIDAYAFVDTGEVVTSAQLTAAVVPEPSSSALIGLAGVALIFRRRK